MRTLSGKVVDAQGAAIPGASINTQSQMSKPQGFARGRTRTGRDGRFQLEVPRGGGAGLAADPFRLLQCERRRQL